MMIRQRIRRFVTCFALAALCVSYAPAQDEDSASEDPQEETSSQDKKKDKKIPKGLKPVAEALVGMDTFNAKPDLKAKYYIYLMSASWCGACRALMPRVVEAYSAMRRKKVEVVLVGQDSSREEAEKYVKSHKAKFPAIWGGSPDARKLPGIAGGSGLPWAVFVDAEGEQIASCAASNQEKGILNWEEVIFKKKPSKRKK